MAALEADFEFEYSPEDGVADILEKKAPVASPSTPAKSVATPLVHPTTGDNIAPTPIGRAKKSNNNAISASTNTSARASSDAKSVTQQNSLEVEMMIKIAVLEARAEMMANYFAEAKLIEYQINELLQPFIVNKPLEKPIRRIAKLLAEHAKIKK